MKESVDTIRTENHLAKLCAIAERYGFPLEEIEAVPDIKKWCERRGIAEDNPWRIGKCLRNRESGKYRVLLAVEITAELQSSVLAAMEFRGFESETSSLRVPEKFLQHLLLHEIAHAMHNDWEEKECDKWAFEELKAI